MSNGADAILIPEIPLDDDKLDELIAMLKRRKARGVNFSIMSVAEGTILKGSTVAHRHPGAAGEGDRPHFGGVGSVLAEIIERRTGLETRVSTLGYIQRGGTPTAYDRSLATALGVKSISLIQEKKLGHMAALKSNQILSTPLSKVVNRTKTVDMNTYYCAANFFG
jgi:6-phosphofructokinase 1